MADLFITLLGLAPVILIVWLLVSLFGLVWGLLLLALLVFLAVVLLRRWLKSLLESQPRPDCPDLTDESKMEATRPRKKAGHSNGFFE